MLKNGIARLGLEIGDHFASYDTFTDYISENYDLTKLGFVLIYISRDEVGADRFYSWARFFAENDICFAFLYTQQRGAPIGKISHLTAEIVAGIREIAGDYFIGDMIGETGGLASWPEGYYGEEPMPRQDFADMREARDEYVKSVAELVKIDKDFGVDNVLAVEATMFSRYNFEAGVKYTFLEMMCANPEIMLASARGASRAYRRDIWGCHIAHEWYGGFRQDDALKYKRLKLAYYYAYMAGADFIYPESGDYGMRSYGYDFPADSKYCAEYRKCWDDFGEFLKHDVRPAGGPKTKVAFVQGALDSYNGWGGSTVWNQFGREEWGYGDAENSYRILDEINTGSRWHDPTVFGEHDDTAAPPMGLYDIIPAEAPCEIMAKYDTLIFTGWSTMTRQIYDNLREYVHGGGHLLISAAHLNTSAKRACERSLLDDGALSEFLGCDITGESVRINSGTKFIKESLIDGVLYPAAGDLNCDPICAGGFAEYAKVTIRGGNVRGVLSDSFFGAGDMPVLIENAYGDGVVSFMTSLDYPGANGIYKLYKTIVKEQLRGISAKCPVKVRAGANVAFAVYNGVLYLLNTDYDAAVCAYVEINGATRDVMLSPLEFKRIEF